MMAPKLPTTSAADYLPRTADGAVNHSFPTLREAVQNCRGCDLYKHATQAVFGEMEGATTEGRRGVSVVMIGEQPGASGGRHRPQGVYITNAVKHFKWEPRGKFRLHKKPTMREVLACKPWLEAELVTLCPRLIVCLGATAAQSLLGSAFKVTQHRGEVIAHPIYAPIIATVHPSSILRAATDEDREREMALFIGDLAVVAKHLTQLAER